jgi:CBS domain-containing protein
VTGFPAYVRGRQSRGQTVSVGDFMHRGAHTCREGAVLAEVARTMGESNCGFLPVVDADGRVVSVVTDRDVCLAVGLGDITLGAASTNEAFTVRADDNLAHAQDLMRLNRVHRLPVVDSTGRPIGVLSLSDLARAAGVRGPSRIGGVTPASVVFLLVSVDRSDADDPDNESNPRSHS